MIRDLIDLKYKKIKAVFFDFDGVLVDSIDIKTKAFQNIFSPYGNEAVELITAHHLRNKGIDRFNKIRHILNSINQQCDEALLNKLANQFASEVKDKVCNAPLKAGVEDLLSDLSAASIPLFIISGTPHNELIEIVKAKKLDGYFKEVCGSPKSKKEILNQLLVEHGIKPGQAIFVGDAWADMEAAQTHQIFFLGVPS